MSSSRRLILAWLAALPAVGCALFPAGRCASPDCAQDARIRAEVRKQIDSRSSLIMFNINVQTWRGVVYLEGVVDTELDRGRAEDIARAVPGVKDVYNGLEIQGSRLP